MLSLLLVHRRSLVTESSQFAADMCYRRRPVIHLV